MFSKGIPKLLLTLLPTALWALGLVACGGTSDSTGSTATTTESTAQEGGSGQGGGSSGKFDEKGVDSFIVPGGDNSIQEYGKEGGGAEIKAAEEALGGYYAALAAGDWDKSCTYLDNDAVKPLEQVAAASEKDKSLSCGELLVQFKKVVINASNRDGLSNGIAALRVEGSRGFALYRDADGTRFFILLAKDGDSWKVAALTPTPVPF